MTTYIEIENRKIEVTHEEKLLFPEAGITKKDLINYYLNISDYLLPLIKDRPLTINCFPQGINHIGYFRQHAPKQFPSWMKTITLQKKDGTFIKHILCQDKASLIYLINKNTITIHRWLSKYTKPNNPDIMVIDIDPPENGFKLASIGAQLVKLEATKLGYKAFLMSTGSKGLHIILPNKNNKSFEDAKRIMKDLILNIQNEYPDKFTASFKKEDRLKHAYLDILRNSYGQTAVAPYSVRATKNASLAIPLEWTELEDPDFLPTKFTIRNIFLRLKNLKLDPWTHFYK